MLLFTPSLAFAYRTSCHSECQELFREISFGNPLVGIFYLISPIFGFVVFYGKKLKVKKVTKNTDTKKLGIVFYLLTGAALLFILAVYFART